MFILKFILYISNIRTGTINYIEDMINILNNNCLYLYCCRVPRKG